MSNETIVKIGDMEFDARALGRAAKKDWHKHERAEGEALQSATQKALMKWEVIGAVLGNAKLPKVEPPKAFIDAFIDELGYADASKSERSKVGVLVRQHWNIKPAIALVKKAGFTATTGSSVKDATLKILREASRNKGALPSVNKAKELLKPKDKALPTLAKKRKAVLESIYKAMTGKHKYQSTKGNTVERPLNFNDKERDAILAALTVQAAAWGVDAKLTPSKNGGNK